MSLLIKTLKPKTLQKQLPKVTGHLHQQMNLAPFNTIKVDNRPNQRNVFSKFTTVCKRAPLLPLIKGSTINMGVQKGEEHKCFRTKRSTAKTRTPCGTSTSRTKTKKSHIERKGGNHKIVIEVQIVEVERRKKWSLEPRDVR